MAIKDWPDGTQPREKLLANGAGSLSDDELLAIFLRTGVKGKSAVELARELIHHFGNLRNILDADQEQFCQAKGLGEATWIQLQAVLEMSKRHLEQGFDEQPIFSNAQQSKDYFQLQLAQFNSEVFACLFLDNQHKLIRFEVLFYGSINQSSVYPREVVKKALQYNAAAIIFAHNHPSGNNQASHADIEITNELKKILNIIDVRVLDHIIVARNEVLSMTEQGLI